MVYFRKDHEPRKFVQSRIEDSVDTVNHPKPERCLGLIAALDSSQRGLKLPELLRLEGYRGAYGTSAEKRVDRDRVTLRGIGIHMQYSDHASYQNDGSYELIKFSPELPIESRIWSTITDRESTRDKADRHLFNMVRIIVALDTNGPMGIRELADALYIENPVDILSYARRIEMVGVPPYRPHDYYTFGGSGGQLTLHTGATFRRTRERTKAHGYRFN